MRRQFLVGFLAMSAGLAGVALGGTATEPFSPVNFDVPVKDAGSCSIATDSSLTLFCLPIAKEVYETHCKQSNPACIGVWITVRIWENAESDPGAGLYRKIAVVAFYRAHAENLLAHFKIEGRFEAVNPYTGAKKWTVQTSAFGETALDPVFAEPRPTTDCQWGCTCSIDTCKYPTQCAMK